MIHSNCAFTNYSEEDETYPLTEKRSLKPTGQMLNANTSLTAMWFSIKD
jgi:hypothetical protein